MRAKYLFLYCTEECLRTFHCRRLPFTASSITASQRTQHGTSWRRVALNTQQLPCLWLWTMYASSMWFMWISSMVKPGTVEDEKDHGTTDSHQTDTAHCSLSSTMYSPHFKKWQPTLTGLQLALLLPGTWHDYLFLHWGTVGLPNQNSPLRGYKLYFTFSLHRDN